MRGTWQFSKTVGRERALRHECHQMLDAMWQTTQKPGKPIRPSEKDFARLRRSTCYQWLAMVVSGSDKRDVHFTGLRLEQLEKVRAALIGKTYTDIHNELSAYLRAQSSGDPSMRLENEDENQEEQES